MVLNRLQQVDQRCAAKLTIVTDVQTLQHANTMNARFQYMGTLGTQRIAAQVQIQTSCRFVARQPQQQILQRLHWQLARGNIQMLQTQRTGEKLLERRRYLFALFCTEEIMRHVQMGQMGGTATQQCSK